MFSYAKCFCAIAISDGGWELRIQKMGDGGMEDYKNRVDVVLTQASRVSFLKLEIDYLLNHDSK